MSELEEMLPRAIEKVRDQGVGAVLEAVLDGPQGGETEGDGGNRVTVG